MQNQKQASSNRVKITSNHIKAKDEIFNIYFNRNALQLFR
jgi:hypothetical protein